ncbi:hypothetical protein HPB47_024412 [Ixodes persulcatus]|uniref:Uncharacterized protein n=1 Tax=Ixodes persulcatus TaxID=34615 RepID=A0AC60Q4D0_IXOPE|nr:hypothetical protein HPB47_024412 [Ixodes persulcatus]
MGDPRREHLAEFFPDNITNDFPKAVDTCGVQVQSARCGGWRSRHASESMRPKKRTAPAIPEALDSFHLEVLRGIIHCYFRKNDGPTLLKNLVFRFKKPGRNSILLERTDLILWCAQYLREIKAYRTEGRLTYFLEETWENAGHAGSKVWKDTTVNALRNAYNRGFSLWWLPPHCSGRGQDARRQCHVTAGEAGGRRRGFNMGTGIKLDGVGEEHREGAPHGRVLAAAVGKDTIKRRSHSFRLNNPSCPTAGHRWRRFPAWRRRHAGHAHIVCAALMRQIRGGSQAQGKPTTRCPSDLPCLPEGSKLSQEEPAISAATPRQSQAPRTVPASVRAAGIKVPGTSTWVVWPERSAGPAGFVSRAPWVEQPRSLADEPPDSTPPPDPLAPFTEEERAALCSVCGVLISHWEYHRHGALHAARRAVRDAGLAAAFRPLTKDDAAAALVILFPGPRAAPEPAGPGPGLLLNEGKMWWLPGFDVETLIKLDVRNPCDYVFFRGVGRETTSLGLKNPSGKGGRVIILHAGSDEGFVQGAAEVFRAKKGTGDYYQEMDGKGFEKRFTEKLLPNIKAYSVIVMDNASYHSIKLNASPSSST